MFQSCLICTDLQDSLDRLINFVDSLSKSGLKQIVFFHSVPLWEQGEVPRVDQEKIEDAKQCLSQALNNVPEGIDVKIEVLSGKPLDNIPKILKNYSIDVIFLGVPITSSLQQKIFGSTSMGLAKLTDKPLMILRPQLISTYTEEELNLRAQHFWRYLLIPYHDSKASRYLIEEIKEYAKSQSGNSFKKCLLVWAIDDVGRQDLPQEYKIEENKKKLEVVKAELEQLGLEVEAIVRRGNPLNEILKAAQVYDISAIAISNTYSSNILESIAPNFSINLLNHSWFPVLFFSPKK